MNLENDPGDHQKVRLPIPEDNPLERPTFVRTRACTHNARAHTHKHTHTHRAVHPPNNITKPKRTHTHTHTHTHRAVHPPNNITKPKNSPSSAGCQLLHGSEIEILFQSAYADLTPSLIHLNHPSTSHPFLHLIHPSTPLPLHPPATPLIQFLSKTQQKQIWPSNITR